MCVYVHVHLSLCAQLETFFFHLTLKLSSSIVKYVQEVCTYITVLVS